VRAVLRWVRIHIVVARTEEALTLPEWYRCMVQAERAVQSAREHLARAEAVREALFTTVEIEDDGVDEVVEEDARSASA
jgi:hypothetical protein